MSLRRKVRGVEDWSDGWMDHLCIYDDDDDDDGNGGDTGTDDGDGDHDNALVSDTEVPYNILHLS
jgi:hypothetical protein